MILTMGQKTFNAGQGWDRSEKTTPWWLVRAGRGKNKRMTDVPSAKSTGPTCCAACLRAFGCLLFAVALASCGKREEETLPGLAEESAVSQAKERARADAASDRLERIPQQRSLRIQAKRAELKKIVPDEEDASLHSETAGAGDSGPEEKLEPAEFLSRLRSAVAGNMDPVDVRSILERVFPDASLVRELQAILHDAGAGLDLQGYAAEALMRAGTPESVKSVLDDLLAAVRSGDSDRADYLMAAMVAPTTTDGMHTLFDLLLGRGAYAQLPEGLPPEVLAAARKALLMAPDREAVGNWAAQLYLDPEVMANPEAMWELFDGVSHPAMLAQLAARAYAENLPDNASPFLARLGESGGQGVVSAVIQMASVPAVPLDDAAAVLYDWSLGHPEDALPGLFIDYVSDSGLPPEQRSVAAFGLAGTADPEVAKQALEKALECETDPVVRTDLQTAISLLETDRGN